ncbi:hypothetical protein BJ878DRAFT_572725 [Calycina marina]|uniref:Uncharacterized protein n=1 Tax=Calycina marina TaxID=1763456 RepID=A0A9P8CIL8_9HELO|nr:hypothetical protein BJ878DRAFT_572725 [Calycina marina]
MASSDNTPITQVNAPWTLKGTVYSIPLYSSTATVSTLDTHKPFLYPPLELESNFSQGKLLGGAGAIQIIRYTESPVGPYDELLLVPGAYTYEKEDGDGKIQKQRGPRITRIYVSQKYTCWNGRTHWNIPKHLACFTFTGHADKGMTISVTPLDENTTAPYFSATFKPIPYLPSFPVTTGIAKYIGIDLDLVQPPLPEGKGAKGELPGTDLWCKITPYQASSNTSLGWWDMKQGVTEEDALLNSQARGEASVEVEHENWWPGSRRWRIGMVMEAAVISFPEGQYWKGPNL